MSTSYFLEVHYFQSLIYVNIKSLTRHGRPFWWWNLQWLHLFHNHPNESWRVGLWLLENRKQSQAWPYLELYVTARSQFQWQEMCWAKNILSRCKSGRCDCNTPMLAIYSTSSVSQCSHHKLRQPHFSAQTTCVWVHFCLSSGRFGGEHHTLARHSDSRQSLNGRAEIPSQEMW